MGFALLKKMGGSHLYLIIFVLSETVIDCVGAAGKKSYCICTICPEDIVCKTSSV